MKDKIKRFIEIIIIIHILAVAGVSVYYSMFHDPLTYGQVISKQHIPEHLEEKIKISWKYGLPLNTYKNVSIDAQYIVIIQGRSNKGKLKSKTIYLNSNQYHYTQNRYRGCHSWSREEL